MNIDKSEISNFVKFRRSASMRLKKRNNVTKHDFLLKRRSGDYSHHQPDKSECSLDSHVKNNEGEFFSKNSESRSQRKVCLQNPISALISKSSRDKNSTALIKIKDFGFIDTEEKLKNARIREENLVGAESQVGEFSLGLNKIAYQA